MTCMFTNTEQRYFPKFLKKEYPAIEPGAIKRLKPFQHKKNQTNKPMYTGWAPEVTFSQHDFYKVNPFYTTFMKWNKFCFQCLSTFIKSKEFCFLGFV